MNHDDNLPIQLINPELEARVVAWVLGEASPFEAAELTRLIAENPALAVFQRRIEAVHGLVGEAARPVREPMVLSPERRAKLLAVIGGGEAGKEDPSVLALPLMGSKKKIQRRLQPWLWAAAACLPLAIVVKLATTRVYDHRGEARPASFPVELPAANVASEEQDGRRLLKAVIEQSEEKDTVQLSAFEVASKPSIAARIKQAFTVSPAPQDREGVDADATAKSNPAAVMQVQGVMDTSIHTAAATVAAASQQRSLGETEVAISRARAARAEKLARETDGRQPGGRENSSAAGTLAQSRSAGSGGGRGGGGGRGVTGGAAGKAINGNVQVVAGQRDSTWNYTGQTSVTAGVSTTLGGAITAPTDRDTYGFTNYAGLALRNGNAPAFSDQKQLFDLSTLQAAAAPANSSRVDQSVAGDKLSFINGSTLNVAANAPTAAPSLTFGSGAIALAEKKDSAKAGFTFDAGSGAGAKSSEETVQLSPFMVSADRDRGYFATNTISGARLNTKLEDLASSISVTTKEQMNDAASLINKGNFLSEAQALAAPASPASSPPSAPVKVEVARGTAAVEADRPVDHAASLPAVDEALRAEVAASTQPVSTFSLHVSDVSFRLAKAALDRGARPDPAAIRPEEFYNAFDYGDPSPATGEPVSCRVEQSAHPFLQQRNLVRIAMKVPAAGRGAGQPLRLTVLLDTSGSMEREDRAASVRQALEVLASLLGPDDRVTLIGFARQPRLLADRVPGDQAARLVEIIGRTPAEGGTNLEEALKLAGEHARAQFTAGAQNRIVVLTDGAANLGNDDPVQLSAQIVTLRQQGIAFDACGIGADGLDDTILEALTRKGDGRYYVINSPAEADAGFAHALAGAFRPAAQNVKVQVRFNPARVRAYRLIGFEQHRLREEDFRNDRVDAAELAAEEAAVALYQVEVLPEGEGELGDVFVRFHNAATGEMVERSWTLAYAPQAPAFERATPSMQLAGIAALVAEKLRGGALAAQIRLGDLAPIVNTLRGHYAHAARVQELVTMFAQTRRLTGE